MRLIDSHTEGEPTRVIIAGGPDLGEGSLAGRAARFDQDHAALRSCLLTEPRGYDAMVGALLCPPVDPTCVTGVIYFNTVATLGMCGHATIGIAVVLMHLGRIGLGTHRIETPVGVVTVTLVSENQATVDNVESYRLYKDVCLDVPGIGAVTGDVAWGGNWFFLAKESPYALEYANIPELTIAATAIRDRLRSLEITGTDQAEIDHIEFHGPAQNGGDARNFVLCPGGAYDRSPCGTGSSAKLACLAADGVTGPGKTWVQESIIGSRYSLTYRDGQAGGILPRIAGTAFVTGETTLIRHLDDPFVDGILPTLAPCHDMVRNADTNRRQ